RLNAREPPHPLLARLDELGDAERLDVALRLEPHLLLDLDLDPEALAVEAVLVPQLSAAQRPEPVVKVLVGAPPGVMDAHRVVRSHRSVNERPPLIGVLIALQVLLEHPVLVPPALDPVLEVDIIDPRRYRTKAGHG